ncbi:DUF1080 domain-containing protein [Roseiconus nitratireducens]|uniref:DUF1080 domain-containing protein n=1 Tax=Roseiconus nitratireducens TaxID=2605748 RepID=A0A5M6DF37_9BACT|nr:DUF1080 domain-containing protein [Roseiconus nitratireducens]KAA5546181.1 DUF1080 domain-containing protein [Roseiconus nitratireducens]
MNRLPRPRTVFFFIKLTLLGTVVWLPPGRESMAQAPATGEQVAEPADDASTKSDSDAKDAKKTTPAKTPWRSLKDHWKPCEFGGDGEIKIKDGTITLGYGSPLTGVVWSGPVGKPDATDQTDVKPVPRDNYELQWDCRRDKGFDFLCAFTFPVADEHVSLVLGGWGGGITGISSIDGRDASDNNTTMFQAFENERWYHARVRVETTKITVWIDDTLIFDHPREGHDFDIRFEMDPCTPLGIANFESDSRIRNIQIRKLDPSELAKAEDAPK